MPMRNWSVCGLDWSQKAIYRACYGKWIAYETLIYFQDLHGNVSPRLAENSD